MVKTLAQEPGGPGSNPGRVKHKDFENVCGSNGLAKCLVLWVSCYEWAPALWRPAMVVV